MNKLSKFGFWILLLGVSFGSYSNAQTPVCNLRFDVFEISGDRVKDVKAVLTDSAAKKTNESLASGKTILFSNVTSGRYKIEIIKVGYERRIKEIELDCKTVDDILTISKVLYLQKGDVKKVTKFGSTVYTAKAVAQEYKGESKAVVLTKPKYPKAARAVRAAGEVQVQVTIDEDGEIVVADAVSGHPLLRQAAEVAAKESRFAPTLLEGQPVIVTGIIVYNFVP